MMNKNKISELPTMQSNFIESICAPLYTAFAKLYPRELHSLIDGCMANLEKWEKEGESSGK